MARGFISTNSVRRGSVKQKSNSLIRRAFPVNNPQLFRPASLFFSIEPKSGTKTSGEYGWGSLVGTCVYLNRLYGERSCRLEICEERRQRTIIFEPEFGEAAPCVCDGVKR